MALKTRVPSYGARFLGAIRVLRPTQWIKNFVVFTAAVFASRFDFHAILMATLAFCSFCATSSAVYLVNDIIDCKADREHPKKCRRPIASGQLPVTDAIVLAGCCLAVGIAFSFLVNPVFTGIIATYLVLQVLYNASFKHQPILDVMTIAGGFVLRALGGAYAIPVEPSRWFILCVGLLALYLGIEKRKAELASLGEDASTRRVLQIYTISWLNRMESVVTAGILMTYALWAILEAHNHWMLLSIIFVIYGLFKYQYLSEQGAVEAPEVTILTHPSMIITAILWAGTCIAILLQPH